MPIVPRFIFNFHNLSRAWVCFFIFQRLRHFFSGASVEVKGINHPVSTTKSGEYWKLLMPGTYFIRVSDSYMGLLTKFYKVHVPQVSKNHGNKSNAVRFDFQL